jgi:YbbR domain-containing protein
VVGQINSVGVEVEVPGIESDVSGSSRVILYDANGNELVGLEDKVTLSRGEVDYQVSVLRVKNLSLDFQVSGEVADGYRFTGVDSDVRTISVEGMKSALASLSTIMVPGELLNISGATQDVTVEVDLNELLPDNVSMAAASATSAMITLRVEKLEERGFSLNTRGLQLAGVSEEYEYEFEEDQVTVWIRGLSEDLDRLDSSSLVGLVDVSMLGAGDMDVDVEMELTEGFELMRSDPLQLHITLIGGEEEPGGEGESAEDTQ